jgi:serine protease Do
VEVVTVEKNGPAERAGLEQGDYIFSLNETQVATVDDLHRLLSKWPPGTPLTVELLRSGRVENYRVTPREG